MSFVDLLKESPILVVIVVVSIVLGYSFKQLINLAIYKIGELKETQSKICEGQTIIINKMANIEKEMAVMNYAFDSRYANKVKESLKD